MKIALVIGTRPEIIKMSPIIRESERLGLDYQIVHTGQHYSHEMDGVFFKELELPKPKYNLGVGSGDHGEQTGRIMIGLEPVLVKEKPDVVLVEGDTNSVLAGAITAAKLHIRVGHVEAGLRSYDRRMPEEVNRVVADHVSDYLFAPTEVSERNLLREGVEADKIFVTGNTVVDAIHQNMEISKRKSDVLDSMGMAPRSYLLVTLHRSENVDSEGRLKEILEGLKLVSKHIGTPILFPVHPRTQKMIKEFDLSLDGITILDPLGFLDFLQLEANAQLVLTDSGGVQEETCVLGVPCVTVRENTERPETVEVGSNILAGVTSSGILNATERMLSERRSWRNPFGEGDAGKAILKILKEKEE